MKVLNNVCFTGNDGEFLRKITFQIVTNVVDQQGNSIPIVTDKLGQTVTVDPLFVKYIIASNNKESLQVNISMCEGQGETTYPTALVNANSSSSDINIATLYVDRFSVNRDYFNRCLSVNDNFLEKSLRYSNSIYWESVGVDYNGWLNFNDRRDLNNKCNIIDNKDVSIIPPAGETIEAVCPGILPNHYFVVVNNRNNQTKYYGITNATPGINAIELSAPNNVISKLLYTINASWKTIGFGVNKIVLHKNKLYHFNSATGFGIDKPYALRILDVQNGNIITGHNMGVNTKGQTWGTNMMSAGSMGLLSFMDNVIRRVKFASKNGTMTMESVVLDNKNNTKVFNGPQFSKFTQ